MEVIIIKQFDVRKVGTIIDLETSTAEILIKKGIVSSDIEQKEVEQKKRQKK
jgi:hypothetical protein